MAVIYKDLIASDERNQQVVADVTDAGSHGFNQCLGVVLCSVSRNVLE
jgi:hypothetical protein